MRSLALILPAALLTLTGCGALPSATPVEEAVGPCIREFEPNTDLYWAGYGNAPKVGLVPRDHPWFDDPYTGSIYVGTRKGAERAEQRVYCWWVSWDMDAYRYVDDVPEGWKRPPTPIQFVLVGVVVAAVTLVIRRTHSDA